MYLVLCAVPPAQNEKGSGEKGILLEWHFGVCYVLCRSKRDFHTVYVIRMHIACVKHKRVKDNYILIISCVCTLTIRVATADFQLRGTVVQLFTTPFLSFCIGGAGTQGYTCTPCGSTQWGVCVCTHSVHTYCVCTSV